MDDVSYYERSSEMRGEMQHDEGRDDVEECADQDVQEQAQGSTLKRRKGMVPHRAAPHKQAEFAE